MNIISAYLFLATTKISTEGEGSSVLNIPSEAKSVTIGNILNTVYFWAGVVAVVVIVIAGFYYTLSQDNPQQVTRAKNAILGSVVGLAIILVAYTITNIVIGAFE